MFSTYRSYSYLMDHGEEQEAAAGAAAAAWCRHEPAAGTLYTSTGLEASLTRRDDFPVEAMCASCFRPIRREQFEVTRPGGDWLLKYIPDRLDAFRARHPQVTIADTGRFASWYDDDGPQKASYASPERLIRYLEARFDR